VLDVQFVTVPGLTKLPGEASTAVVGYPNGIAFPTLPDIELADRVPLILRLPNLTFPNSLNVTTLLATDTLLPNENSLLLLSQPINASMA